MLTSRTKIIILIIGAVAVFGLIVATIFNLWPKKEIVPSGEGQANVDLSFLEKKDAVQGQEFDASNREAFNQTIGAGAAGEAVSPEEQAARSLAVFFVERFGTYSSDAGFANIDDLQSFMTPTMRQWAASSKKEQPKALEYTAFITEVASLERASGESESGRISFNLLANRTERASGNEKKYQQKSEVKLIRDQAGEWLVDSLYWGERL